MRVRFEWDADPELILPVGYHYILQGVVYQNMRTATGYSSFIHNQGFSYGQRTFSMFSFSYIEGKCLVRNKKIKFSGRVAFEVSSPEVFLIRSLVENVEKNGLWFEQTHYSDITILTSDYEVEENDIIVEATSPIVVHSTDNETGKTYYFSPEDPEFAEAVNNNFLRKYEAYYGIPASESIWIEPVADLKKVVTRYKRLWITGYMGIFRLCGKRQYLNFLYQTGVGEKNSQGFGMIEIR